MLKIKGVDTRLIYSGIVVRSKSDIRAMLKKMRVDKIEAEKPRFPNILSESELDGRCDEYERELETSGRVQVRSNYNISDPVACILPYYQSALEISRPLQGDEFIFKLSGFSSEPYEEALAGKFGLRRLLCFGYVFVDLEPNRNSYLFDGNLFAEKLAFLAGMIGEAQAGLSGEKIAELAFEGRFDGGIEFVYDGSKINMSISIDNIKRFTSAQGWSTVGERTGATIVGGTTFDPLGKVVSPTVTFSLSPVIGKTIISVESSAKSENAILSLVKQMAESFSSLLPS
ncbi:MAG: hypothetical protein PHH14_01640 [Candidatus Margulisbacteria bacterium]|nr:hypothetical protein [Candidatus Margulisiibacteriota bacterium]